MSKKLVWKPGTLLAPAPPALVSCGTLEQPNLLTVAWTGIVNTHPAMTYVSIRPERYSYGLIKASGEFVINLTPAALIHAADFCGVRSGRDLDKWAETGLTPAAASAVSAPLVEQCPLSLECRVTKILPLGSHDMFLAEIVAIDVDESMLTRDGKLDLSRAGLAAFAHGEYYELGKRIGTFGFSVRKKTPGKPAGKHANPTTAKAAEPKPPAAAKASGFKPNAAKSPHKGAAKSAGHKASVAGKPPYQGSAKPADANPPSASAGKAGGKRNKQSFGKALGKFPKK